MNLSSAGKCRAKSGGGKSGGKNKTPATSAEEETAIPGYWKKWIIGNFGGTSEDPTHHSSGKGALTIYYYNFAPNAGKDNSPHRRKKGR